MRPILFYAGPLPIYSYGVFMVAGMVALFALALWLGRRAKLSWEQLGPVALGVMVGGMFGARLSQAFVEPDKAAEYLNFFGLFQPGTPGNLLGLMIGGYLGGVAVRESFGLPPMGNFMPPLRRWQG
jgi:prolipoprotein diacylglyceryltransferase